MDQIIFPNQAAFIPNRSINDNNIIFHEIMHHFNCKKGKLGLIAIKIDLAKAYDCVERSFLCQIMVNHGFDTDFSDLIFESISFSSFPFLINGSPYSSLKPSRVIRQRNPMLPALFTLMFDALSCHCRDLKLKGKSTKLKSQGKVPVSLS